MRYGVWLFLVSLLILEGQAVVPQNGPKTPESPTVEKAALALDTPIITIAGLCDNDLLAGDPPLEGRPNLVRNLSLHGNTSIN